MSVAQKEISITGTKRFMTAKINDSAGIKYPPNLNSFI